MTQTSSASVAPAGAVGRSFATLGLGETVARLITFGATVYLARRLGVSGYGVVALAGAVLLYFSHLVDLGLDTLGVSEVAKDGDGAAELVPSLVLGRLGTALVLWLIIIAVGLTVLPQPEGAMIAACGATLLFRGANVRWALIGLDRPAWVALSRVAGEALQAIIIVATVTALGDLGRVPVAQAAGDAFAAVILVLALGAGRRLRVRWIAGRALPVFRAARPLVAHALLALLVFNCDLILLRVFRDASVVGLYAAAYTLVSFLSNMGVSFGYSLLPAFARLADRRAERDALYHSALAQASAATLPMAAGGLVVAGGLIALVFGGGYAAAVLPLTILLWSVPPVWMRTAVQMALVAQGRQRDVLKVTVIGAAVTIVMDLLVIPRWGMVGAAWVTVGTEGLRLALVLWWGRRAGLALPSLRRFVRPVAATAVMALVVTRLPASWPTLAAVAAGAGAYALLLVLVGALRLRRGALPEVRL